MSTEWRGDLLALAVNNPDRITRWHDERSSVIQKKLSRIDYRTMSADVIRLIGIDADLQQEYTDYVTNAVKKGEILQNVKKNLDKRLQNLLHVSVMGLEQIQYCVLLSEERVIKNLLDTIENVIQGS